MLTVTNGLDKMFRVVLDQKFLSSHKETTGIEGSWSSYFELLKSALDKNNVGLETNSKSEIIFKVHYPLMEGARILGQIIMRPRK